MCLEGIWGNVGIAPHIFIFALDGVVSFVPQVLYLSRKDPKYLRNMRLDRPQNWFEHFGEEKNLLLPGFGP
jgi:hypothetical protein